MKFFKPLHESNSWENAFEVYLAVAKKIKESGATNEFSVKLEEQLHGQTVMYLVNLYKSE